MIDFRHPASVAALATIGMGVIVTALPHIVPDTAAPSSVRIDTSQPVAIPELPEPLSNQDAAAAALADRRAARQARERASRKFETPQPTSPSPTSTTVPATPPMAAAVPQPSEEPAFHTVTGSVTAGPIEGAIAPLVGLPAGTPFSSMSMRQLNASGRLLDQLEAGRTFPCAGGAGGGYGDIARGTQVVVRDGANVIVETTVLTGGLLSDTGCAFDFEVSLPDGPFYVIEVSHRGGVTFSRKDLDDQDWTVALRI